MSIPKYEPSGFALQIFEDRYALHEDENFEKGCWRVARFMANVEEGQKREKYAQQFFDILNQNRFSAGGRIWRGAGRPKAQMMNCFTLDDDIDSREGWGETLKNILIISGTGGGVGISFSKVRPRGTAIRGTGGESTGPVSLMKMIDAMCGELRTGGNRRAALMFSLNWNHPDIPEFLAVKLDKKQLSNANISVCIDQTFLKLLEDDGEIIFKWQGEERGRMQAKQLWDKIIQNAWESGDPGIMNIGLMREQNNLAGVADIVSTNPCFTGDMRLYTSNGMMRFDELARLGIDNTVTTDARILRHEVQANRCGTINRPATAVKQTARNQQIYKLVTAHGHEIKCTEYHKFILPDGSRRKLKDLQIGDELLLQSGEGQWGTVGSYEDGLMLGSLTGDGTLDINGSRVCLDFWNEDELANRVLGIVNKKLKTWHNRRKEALVLVGNSWGKREIEIGLSDCVQKDKVRIRSKMLWDYLQDQFGIDLRTIKGDVPECVWQGSREMVCGYLAGLFQADGSVQLSGHNTGSTLSVRLSQSNKQLLLSIQSLLNNFGIVSRIYKRREACQRMLPDQKGGTKLCNVKSQYEIIISRPNAVAFEERIGFAGDKQLQLTRLLDTRGRNCRKLERFITNVACIVKDNIEDVYCLTEPAHHSIIANGLVTAQCGEIPLDKFGSCCLGSVNLSTHVVDGAIDWDLLEETVAIAVRFLDNVLDQNHYPLQQIYDVAGKHRRIGLGIMGLHDMLLKMRFKYDTDGARDMVDQVMDFIKKRAYDTSIMLAIEKGPFQLFEPDKFLKSGFVKKSLTTSLKRRIKEHGIRNCNLLSLAPNGTISIVAGCSSGIEPIFQLVYKQKFNKHSGQHSGEREQENEIVVHPLVKEFLLEDKSLKHFQAASDISPRSHLIMQAICQRHIDQSISKTINIASDYPVEQLSKEIYEFIEGLKGVTVYRDGSKGQSPMQSISLEEAKKHLQLLESASATNDCPSGNCEI